MHSCLTVQRLLRSRLPLVVQSGLPPRVGLQPLLLSISPILLPPLSLHLRCTRVPLLF